MIQSKEWYIALVDECKAIITEAVFTSRWSLIEGYHQLGERIVTDNHFKKYAKGNKRSVQALASNLNTSERTLYYSMQFYEKYPRLDKLPDGKNISWNKIITKYLPDGDGNSPPAWEGRWQRLLTLARLIAEDKEAEGGVRKIAKSVVSRSKSSR